MSANNKYKRRKKIGILIFVLFFVLSDSRYPVQNELKTVEAHSGRTDSSGGHKDNKNKSGLGSYHYHHGLSPHLHDGGICPYDDDGSASSDIPTKSQPKVDTITINSAPSEMKIGETTFPEYKLTTESDNTLNIKSSDTSVVKVESDGSLKAVGEGVATILVESPQTSKEFTITVKPIPVESVTFKDEKVKIQLGKEVELPITIEPADATNKEVEYFSEDEGIATCSTGKLKALMVGTSTITVKTANGLEASIPVEVYEVFTEEIKTDNDAIKVEITGVAQLTVKILPENANNKEYNLKLENNDIIKVDENGNITPLKEGNTKIIIETSNNIIKEIPVEVYHIKTEEIVIQNESDYMNKNIDRNEQIEFEVGILPENATYKEYEVISSNNDIISINSNTYEIVGTGKVTLTFQGHDDVIKTIELKIIDVQKRFLIIFVVVLLAVSVLVFVLLKRKKISGV